MPFRARVLMKRLGMVDPGAARREIERNDAVHNSIMQRMFGIEWMDPTLYAVSLNTSRVSPEDCVEQIAQLSRSESFRETPQSRSILMDQLIEARVRATLGERFGAGLTAIGIEFAVNDGKVTLAGAMSDDRMIADIVRRMHAVEGVTAVQCKIQHLGFVRNLG
jgi:hypothetical protein